MKNADAALYRAKRAGGNRYATSEPRRHAGPDALIAEGRWVSEGRNGCNLE
jgi:hypothetical protein